MKRTLLIAALLLSTAFCGLAQNEYNCFCIIAGRNVTTDGSVILAHNEDDEDDMLLNIYAGSKYLWAEFPGWEATDAFLNRNGVALASDNCKSREDNPVLTDGGRFYEVRATVAAKARTAREGMHIIGEMVEKYGYGDSGRSYMVADANEGWVVSVVNGKHWVAERVPDDKVFIIPNYYIIDEVNLDDTVNFAGSKDIVEYAVSRGWYDPAKDGKFSFRKAYSNERTFRSKHNELRQKAAIDYICGGSCKPGNHHPFAMKPDRKLSVEDLVKALSLHNGDNLGTGSICNNKTVISTIFQLRQDMPKELGCIMWTAIGHPCIEAYIPWYLGTTVSPNGWQRFSTAEEAMDKHLKDTTDLRARYPEARCWKYVDRWNAARPDIINYEKTRRDVIAPYQKFIFKEQKSFERKMRRKYCKGGSVSDPAGLADELNRHLDTQYRQYEVL